MRKLDKDDSLEGPAATRRHSLDELLRSGIDSLNEGQIFQEAAEKFKEFLPEKVRGKKARQPDDGDRQDEPQARDGPANEALREGLAEAVDGVEDEADDGHRDDERNEHEKPGGEVAANAEWHRSGILSARPVQSGHVDLPRFPPSGRAPPSRRVRRIVRRVPGSGRQARDAGGRIR